MTCLCGIGNVSVPGARMVRGPSAEFQFRNSVCLETSESTPWADTIEVGYPKPSIRNFLPAHGGSGPLIRCLALGNAGAPRSLPVSRNQAILALDPKEPDTAPKYHKDDSPKVAPIMSSLSLFWGFRRAGRASMKLGLCGNTTLPWYRGRAIAAAWPQFSVRVGRTRMKRISGAWSRDEVLRSDRFNARS